MLENIRPSNPLYIQDEPTIRTPRGRAANREEEIQEAVRDIESSIDRMKNIENTLSAHKRLKKQTDESQESSPIKDDMNEIEKSIERMRKLEKEITNSQKKQAKRSNGASHSPHSTDRHASSKDSFDKSKAYNYFRLLNMKNQGSDENSNR